MASIGVPLRYTAIRILALKLPLPAEGGKSTTKGGEKICSIRNPKFLNLATLPL